LNNNDIFNIAMEQSALEANCRPEDFLSNENRVVISEPNPQARIYLNLPLYCNLISYGSNIVASVNEDFVDIVTDYLSKYPLQHCFSTPTLHILNDELGKKGYKICHQAEYFLPDINNLRELPCAYPVRLLHPGDFTDLYKPEWSNALEPKRKEHDVLGAGAYDGDKFVGLAGCSDDCETMWQIGIDVLPEYRRQGIASALTSRLAREILDRGKVPFYCAAWSNIRSVRNAVRSGFRPAWVEITSKSVEEVEKANGQGKFQE
jgi:GNAT superfamily N-acetyltransferase